MSVLFYFQNCEMQNGMILAINFARSSQHVFDTWSLIPSHIKSFARLRIAHISARRVGSVFAKFARSKFLLCSARLSQQFHVFSSEAQCAPGHNQRIRTILEGGVPANCLAILYSS